MKHAGSLPPGWRYAKGYEGLIAITPACQIKLIDPPGDELPLRVRPTEHWKPVSGYEELYEVSDMGRVRRIHPYTRGVKPWKGRKGRPRIDLSKDNVKEHWYVYDLVLTAFVGPKPEEPRHFACHLNDDPWDNRLVNLMWGTQSVNERHKQMNNRATRSLESIYRWDRSYQLTDEAIYDIWERDWEDLYTLSVEYSVLQETIWLIRHNMAMIRVPPDKPEALVRRDERIDRELPF